jgi:3-oxoadipate enol-lactonase
MLEAMRGSVDIGGAHIAYHVRRPAIDGGLAPAVLLHPWFGCWQFWHRTVEALPEFTTYAVDLYSPGAGANWQAFASPEGLARAVAAMLDGLRIDRCSLIGNSMGGIAAQCLSAAQPERIGKLVLVGTGARTAGVKPEFRQALDAWIAGTADRAATERLVDALLARRPDDPREFATFVDMVAMANKAFMGSVLTAAFALDLRPRLPQIAASTLVVRGERDAARTRAHVQELLAGIPRSRAVELAGAGHSPQVDSPEPFAEQLRRFLLT